MKELQDQIKSWLNRPFPNLEKKSIRIILSVSFSVFIFLFLLIFQPFGIDDIQFYKPLFILGFSAITFLIMMIAMFISPLIFKQFFDHDNWTVKKVLLFSTFQISVIAIANWIYNSTVGFEIVKQYSLWQFVFFTLAVGFFPMLFFIGFTETLLTQKHSAIANKLSDSLSKKLDSSDNQQIKLDSENKNDAIEIELSSLIAIKSEGNYVHAYYQDISGVKKVLLRNTLTKIAKDLENYPSIQRCHRSFIINFDTVEKITGNARNYNLHFSQLDFLIPVSRNFPKEKLNNFLKT